MPANRSARSPASASSLAPASAPQTQGVAEKKSAKPASGDAVSSTAALVLWLGFQLAVMLIVALRIPLAAEYPQPAERLAAHLMLGGQVVAAALLFPMLMHDGRRTIQIIATALPFQLAAGFLGGIPIPQMLPAAAFVAGWLLTLGIWAACLRAPAPAMLGVACASALTLGAGALRYLRLEFGPPGARAGGIELASPFLATLAALDGFSIIQGWILLGGIAVTGIIVCRMQRARIQRRPPVLM